MSNVFYGIVRDEGASTDEFEIWRPTSDPEHLLLPEDRFIPGDDIAETHAILEARNAVEQVPDGYSVSRVSKLKKHQNDGDFTNLVVISKRPALSDTPVQPYGIDDRKLIRTATVLGELYLGVPGITESHGYWSGAVGYASGLLSWLICTGSGGNENYRSSTLVQATRSFTDPVSGATSLIPTLVVAEEKAKSRQQGYKTRQARVKKKYEIQATEANKRSSVASAYRAVFDAADKLWNDIIELQPISISNYRYGTIHYAAYIKAAVTAHRKFRGATAYTKLNPLSVALMQLHEVRHLVGTGYDAQLAFQTEGSDNAKHHATELQAWLMVEAAKAARRLRPKPTPPVAKAPVVVPEPASV